MYRNLLKSAALAALAIAVPAGAQTPTVAGSATVQLPGLAGGEVDRYYQATRDAPIWFRPGQADAAPALINILKNAKLDGLSRGPELATEVEAALGKAQTGDPAAVKAAERVMSDAWVQYVQTISKPTPGMLYGEKWVTPTTPNTFNILSLALRAPTLAAHLKSVSDINPIYAALREAAAKEAALPGGGQSARYVLNMERARSIPAKGKFVLVDAATARLWMYEDGRPVDSMKVVVGDKKNLGLPTPMVASVIWYATLNPYWHVPDHLVRKIATKHSKEIESYLKAKGYEVVSDWNATQILPISSVDWKAVAVGTAHAKVRQLPGPENSMGKLKFNFANPEGIYLHDTPTRAYFAQSNRTLSNGCIRLEDAKRLGRWLMGREPVGTTGAAEEHVTLPRGIPVYVTYLTAQPHIGEAALTRDVYGWDVAGASGRIVSTQTAAAGS